MRDFGFVLDSGFGSLDMRRLEEFSRLFDLLRPESIREESEIANSDETAGQYMQEEASDEFLGVEGHRPLLTAVSIVAPMEGDLAVTNIDNSVVGDGDSMSIAPKIIQDFLGAAKRWLGIDDPFDLREWLQPLAEVFVISQISEEPIESELSLAMGTFQGLEKASPKVSRKNTNGKKETRTRRNPSLSCGIEAATGHNAMEVGMKAKTLSPSVQHRHESDLGAEVFGIRRDCAQGLGRRLVQHVVNETLVLQADPRDFVRNGEDDMEVLDGQELINASFKPLRLTGGLTFRTMPIAARVVRDPTGPAFRATVDMPTQSCGAAGSPPRLFPRRFPLSESWAAPW